MNLRYTLSFLRAVNIPGLYPIMHDWQAFIRMHFVFAAHESGLLKALATPCDRETLLEKLDVKRPELLDALLDVGLASRELSKKNGRFTIKGKRSRAIMGAEGDILAALIQANVTYYSDAYRNAAHRMHGGELGEDIDNIGELVARVSKIGEPMLKDFIAAIVRNKGPMRVLDVGCGSGVLLRSTHDANPDARGIGLDIDEGVVGQAQRNILSWGLADRFDIRLGDIRRDLREEIAGPFDLITLYNVLYYFIPEERPGLLADLRSILSPAGMLAVAMSFRSMGKDMATANLNMVNSSLKGLTPLPDLDEVASALKQCGFRRIEIHRFMPGSTFCGLVAYQ